MNDDFNPHENSALAMMKAVNEAKEKFEEVMERYGWESTHFVSEIQAYQLDSNLTPYNEVIEISSEILREGREKRDL